VTDGEKRGSRWFRWAVHIIVLAIVVWGVRRTIVDAIHQLGDFQWRLNPSWLVAAACLYLLGMLPMGLFWFRALRALGQRPGLGETLRAFYIGHLGKYVPGKAMVVVLRTGLVRGARVRTSVAAASVFLETLTMMAVGAMLAAAVLVFWLWSDLRQHTYLLPLAIGLMLLAGLPTLPPVFRRLAMMLGVGKSDPEMATKLKGVSFRLMSVGWIRMTVGWILMALSLWAVMRAMGIAGLDLAHHLPAYLAAVSLAMVAGFVSLIPGGAGVRELILTAILGEIYFGRMLNLPLADATALGTAVVLRLVWLTAEVLLAGLLFFGVRRESTEDVEAN
jgi:uncharacterized membrane protein YbhN (UPF0104 family)